MQHDPPPGHTAELERVVDAASSIQLGDAIRVEVYSTPSMIDLMEHTARAALAPFLASGEESVGVDVQVEHVAATRVGQRVRGKARVTRVENSVVHFEVEAFDGRGRIGHGTHRRAVIPVQRLAAKLAAPDRPPVTPSSAPPELHYLQLQHEGGLLRVQLDRQEKKNALHRELTAELETLTTWLETNDEIRVVVLAGAGDTFSAGDDIRDIEGAELSAAQQLSQQRGALYQRWMRLPQVLIALVRGLALGGGCVCAYHCDFVIASQNARLGMPEIRLGWPPNYGVARLVQLVGVRRAMQLCCTAEPISAARAEAWGLITEVVPDNRLESAGEQLAQRLLRQPCEALRAAKQVLHADSGSAEELATEVFVRCLGTENAQEGIAAFLQKRSARFG